MEAHIMLQQQICLKNVWTIIFSLIYIIGSSNKNVLKIQLRHILNNVNPNVKGTANHAGPSYDTTLKNPRSMPGDLSDLAEKNFDEVSRIVITKKFRVYEL